MPTASCSPPVLKHPTFPPQVQPPMTFGWLFSCSAIALYSRYRPRFAGVHNNQRGQERMAGGVSGGRVSEKRLGNTAGTIRRHVVLQSPGRRLRKLRAAGMVPAAARPAGRVRWPLGRQSRPVPVRRRAAALVGPPVRHLLPPTPPGSWRHADRAGGVSAATPSAPGMLAVAAVSIDPPAGAAPHADGVRRCNTEVASQNT